MSPSVSPSFNSGPSAADVGVCLCVEQSRLWSRAASPRAVTAGVLVRPRSSSHEKSSRGDSSVSLLTSDQRSAPLPCPTGLAGSGGRSLGLSSQASGLRGGPGGLCPSAWCAVQWGRSRWAECRAIEAREPMSPWSQASSTPSSRAQGPARTSPDLTMCPRSALTGPDPQSGSTTPSDPGGGGCSGRLVTPWVWT